MTTPTPEAIAAAQAAQRKWSIPACITLAQWALESGWGQHMPQGSNNPFGVKALPGQPSVTVTTREVVTGRSIWIQAAFRKYASLSDAFDDHGRLLATAACYAPARARLPDVGAFADALTGVYATDPGYGAELRAIIVGSRLQRYDVGSSGPAPATSSHPPVAAPVPISEADALNAAELVAGPRIG